MASEFTFEHVFTTKNSEPIDQCYGLDKKKLGEGSYGSVFTCRRKVDGKVDDSAPLRACKTVAKKSIKDPERFQQEINIQKNLDHPNIVKLYEYFEDGKNIYLIMELCTGGELFDRIIEKAESSGQDGRAFDIKDVATYMMQILGAMRYLHKQRYVHRDIKPENFLLQTKAEDAEIKVIDFGLSTQIPKEGMKLKTKAGTPYYVAPEVLNGSYDEKCDIWSCGVICYILICGYPPFYGDTDAQILKSVKKGVIQFDPNDWDDIPKEVKSFITSCCTLDVAKRPSAEELFDDPWLKNAMVSSATPLSTKAGSGLASKMKQFRSASKLKKVVLTMIAKNIKDEDLTELRSIWSALDINKDGTLTHKEILDGLKKAKIEFDPEVLLGIDTDGSGVIDYSEFIASTLQQSQYMKEELAWQAFRVFDTDNDGQITKAELLSVLKDKEVAEEVLKEVDSDGNETISFEEFKNMLAANCKLT